MSDLNIQHSTTNIWDSYTHTNPCSIQVDGDKGGWDGEVVDKGVEFQHEPDLV